MRVPATPQKAKTAFQKELEIFSEQLKRLGDCILNQIFDLTVKGSQRRNRMVIFLFLALGIFFVLRAHSATDWRAEIGSLFSYFLDPVFARANPNTPVLFFSFVLSAFFKPQTLRYLPVFVLPFLIALQWASIYLADIFELSEVRVAREFILQVALTASRESIRIGNGQVTEKDRKSPIFLIGGPGKVLVELDSVALFEKPDGRPHVIGPTVKGKAKLEGFERFRQAIDLRDQYTDPQKPVDVRSRSLDGIPVETKDVRFVYSVWRNNKPRTAEYPHPYGNDKIIENLVYQQASQVVDAIPPSVPPEVGSLFVPIIRLIRRELGGFMSKHRLAEYLASIGIPEVEQARKLEGDIADVGNKVVSESDPLQPREVPDPPNFQYRSAVSSLFTQFTEGFSSSASKSGVQLQWIGVGIWKMPTKITDEIVTGKHLEAWRLSQENMGRGSQDALDGLRQESQLQQTLRLIQKVPLARFNESSAQSHRDTVRDLLIGYREQLIEIIELLVKSRRSVPPSLRKAIKHIETVLGIKHWVGPTSPSSAPDVSEPVNESKAASSPYETTTGVPSTQPILPEEAELYQDLYVKTGRDADRVERLIEYERNLAPHAERIELLRRAIERWLKDNR